MYCRYFRDNIFGDDMDWWKLFSGTFVLIFLAELGDKTQLAALAKTADAPDSSTAKWVVFLGASAALVLSTFVAVFLGHILKSIIPDERYIKAAAAILFLVFGVSILWEVTSSFRRGEAAAAEMTAPAGERGKVGVVGGLALSAAMDLERMAGERYRKLADSASPELAAVLREIAKEEDSHLTHLREFDARECADEVWSSGDTPELSRAKATVRITPGDQSMLRGLVEHEESTSLFYRSLAKKTLIPSVRNILAHLADEEDGHAKRLREFI
jgi:rubrerythrin